MAEILIERIVIREVSYVHFSVTVKRGLEAALWFKLLNSIALRTFLLDVVFGFYIVVGVIFGKEQHTIYCSQALCIIRK